MIICNTTTSHTRYDIRIFQKFCNTFLKIKNSKNFLIVCDGKGNEIKNNINIIDIGKFKNRYTKYLLNYEKFSNTIKKISPDILIANEPELIPTLYYYKKNIDQKVKIVFDSHEYFTKYLLEREFILKIFRKIISKIYEKIEILYLKKFDGIISATKTIHNYLSNFNDNSIIIENFAILKNKKNILDKNQYLDRSDVIYVGANSLDRGLFEMCKAVSGTNISTTLHICGQIDEKDMNYLREQKINFKKINFAGFCNKEKLDYYYSKSFCSLLIFHPTPNQKEALPNKIFEYMAEQIPVISSKMLEVEKIIQNADCGYSVESKNIFEITNKIEFLYHNKHDAYKMGQNAFKEVNLRYSWDIQENKLINFVKGL